MLIVFYSLQKYFIGGLTEGEDNPDRCVGPCVGFFKGLRRKAACHRSQLRSASHESDTGWKKNDAHIRPSPNGRENGERSRTILCLAGRKHMIFIAYYKRDGKQ